MESKPAHTLKLLCSYGGKILPRPTDGQLRYVGGHTRVLAVDRSVSFSELMVKLVELCGSSVTLRCQLPKGDLETLISITNDEDLANIFHEYDRASSELTHPLKIRAVLSPPRSMMIKKLSPVPSSSTSSASHSPFRSPHTSAESLPYAAVHRIVRQNRSPRAPLGFPIKACCYPGRFEGSPRFLYRGPHCSNYCH
ncbi:protein PAL OF QUIRKY-like [Lotus japonicus]|uniref:protein PAL OF QUIRKY-like n=1 Tax=Lotus japonicus TaxID=34305 RepID=UPI00258BECDE|nr:protein PAL OF QUIRKY-like [Lotus japonicus]